jgi:hypothetical protein
MEYKFNYHNSGEPVVLINNRKAKNKICIEKDGILNSKLELTSEHLDDPEEVFQVLPRTSKDRQIIYIPASEGSGKSYWCCEYIKAFHKIYPKQKIFVFSSLEDDETLDKCAKLFKRVKIDDDWVKNPFSIYDFKDFKESDGGCLCIFDDVDNISNKYISEAVYTLINNIIDVGRHFNISLIYTAHKPADKKRTSCILNSCHSIVYFPYGVTRSTKYVLESYFDIDKKKIDELKKFKSRWMCVSRQVPRMFIGEKDIGFLD